MASPNNGFRNTRGCDTAVWPPRPYLDIPSMNLPRTQLLEPQSKRIMGCKCFWHWLGRAVPEVRSRAFWATKRWNRSRFWGRECDEALFSGKKRFQWKGGRIQWMMCLVRISTGKAIQWRVWGHSPAGIWKLKSCCPHPLPQNQLLLGKENAAQYFFWSLGVVDVRPFGSWTSAPKCLFFQGFRGRWTKVLSWDIGARMTPGCPRDIRPKNFLFELLFRISSFESSLASSTYYEARHDYTNN